MPLLRSALLAVVVALAGCGDALVTDASMQVDGQRVASQPLGLRLDLPEGWELQGPQSDADFVAVHEESSAVLTGKVRKTDPPEATLEDRIDALLAARRAEHGELSQVQRRDTTLAGRSAKGVGYGVPRGDGVVPVIVALIDHGPYTVQFTCVGLATARSACERALGELVLPAP